MSRAPLLGAVLAGGESRRFGRDKATAVIAGTTLMERAAEVLAATCAEVVVITPRPSPPPRWNVIPDLRTGQGPLAGIEAALAHAEGLGLDGTFVLACDLPLVDTTTVRRVIEGAGSAAAGAPSRRTAPAVEPLCAFYRLSCLPAVQMALDRGERAVHDVFFAVGGVTVEVAGDVFLNVNRPDDLPRAEAALGAPEVSES